MLRTCSVFSLRSLFAWQVLVQIFTADDDYLALCARRFGRFATCRHPPIELRAGRPFVSTCSFFSGCLFCSTSPCFVVSCRRCCSCCCGCWLFGLSSSSLPATHRCRLLSRIFLVSAVFRLPHRLRPSASRRALFHLDSGLSSVHSFQLEIRNCLLFRPALAQFVRRAAGPPGWTSCLPTMCARPASGSPSSNG